MTIYLDNAATSWPKASGVAEAMATMLQRGPMNPGRSSYRGAVAVERMIEGLRSKLARLFEADDPDHIIFTLNGTDALNMAIKGAVAAANVDRPHVVTTVLEHNSVGRPLRSLRQAGRIELTTLDCDEAGCVDPDAVRTALRSDTRLVAVTHASNVTGVIQPIEEIGRRVAETDALLLVDAAQTAGVLPISMRDVPVDLLATPGHKGLLGPPGTGLLVVGERAATLPPWREGGTGGDSSHPVQPSEYPHRLEAGTPNVVGLAGLDAAVDHLATSPAGEALTHERTLCHMLIGRLAFDEPFRLLGATDGEHRVGVVSFELADVDAREAGVVLDQGFDIAVRCGLHCAPGTHRRFGTFPGGAVRVSPGPNNTADDIDALLNALDEIAAME